MTKDEVLRRIIAVGLQRKFKRVALVHDPDRDRFQITCYPAVYLGEGKESLVAEFPADSPDVDSHIESFLVRLEEARAYRVLALARRPLPDGDGNTWEAVTLWVQAILEVAND